MIAGLGFAGVSVLLPLIEEGGSLARFAKLSRDADSRASIYSDWWRVISDQGLIFGVPPEVIAAQPVAPHNAVLESLAQFGGGHGVAGWHYHSAAIALPRCWLAVARANAGGAWYANDRGFLAQYTVWIALVLLNAQRGSADGVGIETVSRSPHRARRRPASGYTLPGSRAAYASTREVLTRRSDSPPP